MARASMTAKRASERESSLFTNASSSSPLERKWA